MNSLLFFLPDTRKNNWPTMKAYLTQASSQSLQSMSWNRQSTLTFLFSCRGVSLIWNQNLHYITRRSFFFVLFCFCFCFFLEGGEGVMHPLLRHEHSSALHPKTKIWQDELNRLLYSDPSRRPGPLNLNRSDEHQQFHLYQGQQILYSHPHRRYGPTKKETWAKRHGLWRLIEIKIKMK